MGLKRERKINRKTQALLLLVSDMEALQRKREIERTCSVFFFLSRFGMKEERDRESDEYENYRLDH